MEFLTNDKEEIGKLILSQWEESGMSQSRFAVSIGFSSSDISNLKNENWKKNPTLIGARKWLTLARRVDYCTNNKISWNTAETEVFKHIFNQLTICQQYSFCNIFCDVAGIGKTHTCLEYSKRNRNVFYLKCSSYPTKNKFIAALAKRVGVSSTGGTYDDLLEDAIYLLRNTEKPLIILDEAGDLEDKVYQVVKRIYNDLEGFCGIYMIGADALEKRINKGISCKKVGFTEVFSRFGGAFSKITPEGSEYLPFIEEMGVEVLMANGYGAKTASELIGKIKRRDVKDNFKGVRRIDLRNVFKVANLERGLI